MSVSADDVAEWAKLQPPKGKGKPTPEQVCPAVHTSIGTRQAGSPRHSHAAVIQSKQPRCHPLLLLPAVHSSVTVSSGGSMHNRLRNARSWLHKASLS